MYGEEKLNNHYILRYTLTKEFFETFHSLKYHGIELTLPIVRQFHIYIKRFVNANRSNQQYVKRLQKKHKLYTMKDAQRALARIPRRVKNLSNQTQRKTILLPGRFVSFALKQFPSANIVFLVSTKEDEKALQSVVIPSNMKVFNYHASLNIKAIPKSVTQSIVKKANRLLNKQKRHRVFGKKTFRNWFRKLIKKSIKIIATLEELLLNNPIKIIVDHVEIINPGTTLSLLARKFNLPFVNMPQVLIGDRSLIPTRATYYFVWGKLYKEWLIKRGIHPSRIKETGNINFEYQKNNQTMSKQRVCQLMRIPSNHLIITYTTQPFSKSVNQQITNWFTRAVHSSLPLTIVIRPHPYDKLDYSRLFQGKPNIVVAPKTLKLYDLLYNSDIVATISSNTGIEGALLGKALFILQPKIPYHYEHHNNNFNAHLANAKAGPAIYNQRQLASYLSKVIASPTYRDVLRRQSQRFITQTLNPTSTPSVHIRQLMTILVRKR